MGRKKKTKYHYIELTDSERAELHKREKEYIQSNHREFSDGLDIDFENEKIVSRIDFSCLPERKPGLISRIKSKLLSILNFAEAITSLTFFRIRLMLLPNLLEGYTKEQQDMILTRNSKDLYHNSKAFMYGFGPEKIGSIPNSSGGALADFELDQIMREVEQRITEEKKNDKDKKST